MSAAMAINDIGRLKSARHRVVANVGSAATPRPGVSEVPFVLRDHGQRLKRRDLRYYRTGSIVLGISQISDIAKIGLCVGQVMDVKRKLRIAAINAKAQIDEGKGGARGLGAAAAIE
jgi:hypothetical protein